MVRIGFSIKHFLPAQEENRQALTDRIRRGLENKDVSWAKSEATSHAYVLQRCCDLGWNPLICINPSFRSPWDPFSLVQSADTLRVWMGFCFTLAKSIQDNWPGLAEYFEITNEPDIGYFDGETYLPDYRGPSGGLTPVQYSLLLQAACRGIKEAVPQAKILGPGLASWNRTWVEEVLAQDDPCLDGLSYHNVGGHLKDEDVLKEARQVLSRYVPKAKDLVFNSEWAWWPNHDIDDPETAIRIAQILHNQAVGDACGSLYLGPAQPQGFKKGLGVFQYSLEDPNAVEKSKTYFAFRSMVRGILGGRRLEAMPPTRKLNILALQNDRGELVITVINPKPKKYRTLSIMIDESIPVKKSLPIKMFRFDRDHSDSHEETDLQVLGGVTIKPESILQFVLPLIPEG